MKKIGESLGEEEDIKFIAFFEVAFLPLLSSIATLCTLIFASYHQRIFAELEGLLARSFFDSGNKATST